MAEKPTYEELEQRIKALEKECARLRRAKKEWQKSEKLYRTLVESLQEGIWVIDKDARTSFVNPSMVKMLGYAVEEMQGRPLFDFMDEEGIQNAKELLRRRQEGASEQHDFEFVGKDGKRLFAIVVTAPILDKQGNYDGALAGIIDVTERRRTEDVLHQSQEELRRILDATTDGIWTWYFKTDTLSFSPKYYTMLGYKPNEFPASYENWGNLIHPHDKERALSVAEEYLKTKPDSYENEFRLRTQGGDYRWIHARARVVERDANGEALYMIGNHEDITERKRTEEALRKRQELHKEAQRVAHIGHWELDPDIGTPVWSEEIFRIFGLDPDKGEPSFAEHETHVHPEDWPTLDRAVRKAGMNGTSFDLVFRILKPDGEIGWMHVIGTTSLDDEGKVAKLFGTAQDVTALWRAEEALRQSESKFRALFENMIDGVAIYEARNGGDDFVFVDLNRAGGSISSTSKDQAVGQSVLKMFPCVKELGLFEVFRRVFLTGKSERHPTGLYKDDRISKWVENSIFKLSPKDIAVVYSDETERQRAEQQLKDSRDQLQEQCRFMQTLIDAISSPVFYKDTDGKYLGCNKALSDFIGKRRNEIVGKTVHDMGPKEITDKYKDQDDKLFDNPGTQVYEWKVKDKDGELRDVILSKATFTDKAGNVAGLIGVISDISELKRGHRELQIIADNVPGLFSYVDANGHYRFVNKEYEHWFGIPQTEIVGKHYGDILGKEATQRLERRVQAVLSGQEVHFEEELPYAHGGARWIRAHYVPDVGPDGSARGLFALVTDVSEQKRVELALKRSEEKYRRVTENIPVVVYSALPDAHSINLLVSGRIRELTGYSAQEFMDRSELYMSILHPEDKKYVLDNIEAHQQKRAGLDMEYRIISRDGTTKWIRDMATPAFDENGSMIRIDGFMEDITRRKATEIALKESEERYRGLFDNATDFVYTLDLKGNFTDINCAAECLTGYARTELIGMNWRDYVCRPAQRGLLRAFARILNTGRPLQDYPLKVTIKDGSTRHYETSATPLKVEGQPVGFQGISKDVTERKQAEEELVTSREDLRKLSAYLQSSREQERTSVARAIHDDLGQALTALKMDLHWSKKRLRKDESVVRDKMDAMTELLDETIESVKRISSELRPGVLDDLGFMAAIEWMAEGFQERTGIECELNLGPEEIILDREHSTAVFRIFQEALTNVSRHAEASRVTVRLEEKRTHLELEVRDDGKGIEGDQIEDAKSFGLMGMRERALALRGDVLIRRVPGRGKGTIVKVRIPKG